jgi:hypothetical protein
MTSKHQEPTRDHLSVSFLFSILVLSSLISSALVGCRSSAAKLAAVDYTPLSRGDWQVSTPAEQVMSQAF